MAEYWNEELETKPWQAVEAWQAKQLSTFIQRLLERSDFYHKRLHELEVLSKRINSLEALESLPFTTKDEIRRSQENPPIGQPLGTNQAASLRDIVQTVTSSGTTGRPVYYGLTRHDLEVWSDAIANMFFTAGIRSDDVVAHLTALPMVAGGLPYADGFRRIGAMLVWLGGFSTERVLSSLPQLQVTAILATTSFGVHLTDHCRNLIGCEPHELKLRKFVAGGEPGLSQPDIRRKISQGWGIRHIREIMGLADVMAGLWSECEDSSGMHFNAQRYVIVELVNSTTGGSLPWVDGSTGELVYTTFDREATPVLRFRSGDHIVVTGTSCPCGRTAPKVRCIGRTDDMLIYKGMNVFPSAIRDIILTRFSEWVEPYLRIWKDRVDQVRFDAPIPVEIEARRGTDPNTLGAIAEAIAEEVRKQLQVRVHVSMVPAGTVPRTTYKTPLVYVRPTKEVQG
ncbi:MAG: hypothetical protein HY695_32765 [Deltaproteobacteria bacterium]|nr:hypothetical protein [Deltaproteobacteria bacterium]